MSRCVDGSSSSSTAAPVREAGGQQHALPLAAAQRRQRAVAELQAVGPPHRLFGDPAILVRFEPAVGVRIASHQHQLLGAHGRSGANDLRQMRDQPRAFDRRSQSSGRPIVEHAPRPRSARRSPATMSSSVLLPAPLRPITADELPGVRRRTTHARSTGTAGHLPGDVARRCSTGVVIAARTPRSQRRHPFGGVDDARAQARRTRRRGGVDAAGLDRLDQRPCRSTDRSLIGRRRSGRPRSRPCRRCRRSRPGSRLKHGLHRNPRVLGLAGDASTFTPPAIVDDVVQVRAGSDGDEIGRACRCAGRR